MRNTVRLFTHSQLYTGNEFTLNSEQSHYVVNVMRLKTGDTIKLFDGKEGEWLGTINIHGKRALATVNIGEQLRQQEYYPDLWLLFALIKPARLPFIIEKATELGVSRLLPIITEHTTVSKINTDKLIYTAIEASEQSERLTVPILEQPQKLDHVLANWDDNRCIIVCDETKSSTEDTAKSQFHTFTKDKLYAIMVGPEGGFGVTEIKKLKTLPFVKPIHLGPRIMRSETAALAAISCWQAYIGDWT